MLSKQEAEALISEPKIAENHNVDLANFKTNLTLHSEKDLKLRFNLQITQSDKLQLKLTNHHYFNTIGLLRLDYRGRHTNPENFNEYVPQNFHKYTGKVFDISEPHIHIYLENWDLKWAIPIDEYGFPVKNIISNEDIAKAIKMFTKEINLKTDLSINFSLFS